VDGSLGKCYITEHSRQYDTHNKYNSNATVMIDKIITLLNEGYTDQKSTYTLNKIEHIYQSNLQCGLLT